MIKGIIFDLDGVICFTDKYHFLAWKAIADEEGIYFDEVINNRLRGVSRMESLNIILERSNKVYTQIEKEELATKKNEIYKKLLLNMSPEDVKEDDLRTLKTLKEKGIKLAIGSSSKNTKFILERLQIIDLFDAISDGTMIKKTKPDPEVFLLAASLINLKPSDCLVVEDAEAGIIAANKGNFVSVGIGPASKLEIAQKRIEKLSDLLTLI